MDNELIKTINKFEKSVEQTRVELILSKGNLQIAYDYKDKIYGQMKSADQNIEKLQLLHIQQVQKLNDLVTQMKTELNEYANKLVEA